MDMSRRELVRAAALVATSFSILGIAGAVTQTKASGPRRARRLHEQVLRRASLPDGARPRFKTLGDSFRVATETQDPGWVPSWGRSWYIGPDELLYVPCFNPDLLTDTLLLGMLSSCAMEDRNVVEDCFAARGVYTACEKAALNGRSVTIVAHPEGPFLRDPHSLDIITHDGVGSPAMARWHSTRVACDACEINTAYVLPSPDDLGVHVILGGARGEEGMAILNGGAVAMVRVVQ